MILLVEYPARKAAIPQASLYKKAEKDIISVLIIERNQNQVVV
tara:strand:- start:2280 stop:2408 length:129 start_codon:yes stop_codon:yes gene_type:complete